MKKKVKKLALSRETLRDLMMAATGMGGMKPDSNVGTCHFSCTQQGCGYTPTCP